MIRYILVDDNRDTLDKVKNKIDTIASLYNLVHVQSYHSSLKAFEKVLPETFDVLIVDYEMPVYNGIELADKIAKNKHIIFLTSTSNNEKKVINSLDISGFLSKPFEVEEFEKVLKHKIIPKLKGNATHNPEALITLHVGKNRDVSFKPEQAYYISTSKNINGEKPDKNCVHIYGKHDAIIAKNVRKSINELHDTMAAYDFEKTNQSTIINMTHFKERDNTNISLFNCQETFEVTAKEKIGFVQKIRRKLGV